MFSSIFLKINIIFFERWAQLNIQIVLITLSTRQFRNATFCRKGSCFNNFIHAALCELFDKADTGGDGTISIAEYVAMCDEYGVELTEEHLEEVRAIANDNGEVSNA